MADGEGIQQLVCDNGTGMVKARFAGDDAPRKSTRDAIWGRILAESTSKEDFLGRVEREQPHVLARYRRKLLYAANYMWPTPTEVYTPRYRNFPHLPAAIQEWCDKNLYTKPNPRPDRPISLILEGPPRTGKTEWARSLGPHNYFANLVDFSLYNNDALYNVLDNVKFKSLPNKKGLLGAKRDYTSDRKYRKKAVTMKGGIPTIVLCNEDMSYHRDIAADPGFAEWASHNVIFINIDSPLF